MIGYLNGTVQKKLIKSLILKTDHIGYLVFIPAQLLEKTKENEPLELYIHTKVREDDISLYGFESFTELEFFKTVLGVNGIGPKLALEILSQPLEKTKMAIINKDLLFLSKIPGIGKKTAERIVVELQNKITVEDIDVLRNDERTNLHQDAFSALESLGYQRFEIQRILKNVPENITETEEVITYFLRNI